MNRSTIAAQLICWGILMCSSATVTAQSREDQIVRQSLEVLKEIMAIPVNGIPRYMLNDAQAVAIIPNVIKGSFVVGARNGNGVVMIRDEDGGWHAPDFISLTGGNIGWQVGLQSTDIVLVFKTRKSVEGLLTGRMTLGADAAIAAGPLGRQASAATDSGLGAQIYSYSRSRGLFAGVSFDGSVIRTDPLANATYYRAATPGGPVIIPASAQQLGNLIMEYTGNNSSNPGAASSSVPAIQTSQAGQLNLAQPQSSQEVDYLRDELARAAPRMYGLLDASWQQYLGLPAQVFQKNGHPSSEAINQCLSHFEMVRNDRRYAALANHSEFQSTYGLLKRYAFALANASRPLQLPAPPASEFGGRQ
jgi:lipid-binding SYLF domain-containing protein